MSKKKQSLIEMNKKRLSFVELDDESFEMTEKIQKDAVVQVISSLSEKTQELSLQNLKSEDCFDSIHSIVCSTLDTTMNDLSDLIDTHIAYEIEDVCSKHYIDDNKIKKNAFILTKKEVTEELQKKTYNAIYNQTIQYLLYNICDTAMCRKYSIEKIITLLINALLNVIINPRYDNELEDYVKPQLDFNEIYRTIITTSSAIIESYKERISSPNDEHEFYYHND